MFNANNLTDDQLDQIGGEKVSLADIRLIFQDVDCIDEKGLVNVTKFTQGIKEHYNRTGNAFDQQFTEQVANSINTVVLQNQ